MFAIYKKELRSYFTNAIGYVYIGVFLAVSAALCSYTTLQQNSYSTSMYFIFLIYSFIILIPLLTMRLFSEEKKMKTEQLLLTAPVTITGMVFGKYLAAFTLFLSSVLVSCVNLFPLYVLGAAQNTADPDSIKFIGVNTPQIIGSLLGIILIGAAMIAVGMLISSLTENQLSAAVITIAVIASMLVINMVVTMGDDNEGTRVIGSYVVRSVLSWFSIFSRFGNFGYGILDFSSLLYYISFAGIFVYLTIRVYEMRRWS